YCSFASHHSVCPLLFFFNEPATPAIYTLSLHDALPICWRTSPPRGRRRRPSSATSRASARHDGSAVTAAPPIRRSCCHCTSIVRSEEHTSELQSLTNLVCRLLLEKKKQNITMRTRAE